MQELPLQAQGHWANLTLGNPLPLSIFVEKSCVQMVCMHDHVHILFFYFRVSPVRRRSVASLSMKTLGVWNARVAGRGWLTPGPAGCGWRRQPALKGTQRSEKVQMRARSDLEPAWHFMQLLRTDSMTHTMLRTRFIIRVQCFHHQRKPGPYKGTGKLAARHPCWWCPKQH